jgi:spermidine synthase
MAATDPSPDPRPHPRHLLEVLVFVVGAGTLGAEIAAARLLAPWFGASTIVWANTIAIVLVSLSIGYALGGRLADRDPRPEGLAWIVLVAAALLAVVPFVSGPFLRQAVVAVDQLSAATFVGSLVGVGALLAVPLLLLGMVSPYVVRLRMVSVDGAGRTAGRLSSISTVGSLTGTFLASLLLIPLVGTRRTFLVFAAAMALAALPLLVRRRRRLPAAAVPAAILGLLALPSVTVKGAEGVDRVVWERETEYQYARVLERSDGERVLELNEGHAVHSVLRPGSHLVGRYWDDMLALSAAGERGVPRSVAILGNAAGTTARAIGHYFPNTRIDAVEIDDDLTEVGRELFDLRAPHLTVHTADARPWLHGTDQRFDVIMVDAYRQPYIPFYLASREFFTEVRDHLEPGGLVIVNVGHPEGSDALEQTLAATMAAGLGSDAVWRDPVRPTSTVLVGAPSGKAVVDPAAQLRAGARDVPAELAAVMRATAGRLAPPLIGGRVYTDDVAPVEWLIDSSLAAEAG